MRGHPVVQRADQGNLVPELRLERKELAKVPRPGTAVRMGRERASVFRGRVRLEVVGLQLAGSAKHPEKNDSGVRFDGRLRRGRPGGQQVR